MVTSAQRAPIAPVWSKYVVAAIATAVFLLLNLASPIFEGSRFDGELRSFLHLPLFALVALSYFWFYGHSNRQQVAGVLGLLLLAICGEGLEALVDGTVSIQDLMNNGLGLLAGLLTWRAFKAAASVSRSMYAVAAAGIVLLAVIPAALALGAWLDQRSRFPVLFDAQMRDTWHVVESKGDLDEVRLLVEDDALRVKILHGKFPGIVVWNFPSDWTNHSRLAIDLENPGDDVLGLEVHVYDRGSSVAYDDRFNARADVPPGTRSTLEFELSEIARAPASREMDLSRMSVIAIYRGAGIAEVFRVHGVRLE